MSRPQRPHQNCYWVEDGELLAGEYPGDLVAEKARAKISSLLDAGVTFFLDTTPDGELRAYHDLLAEIAAARLLAVSHQRFPIPDLGVPSVAEMNNILDAIDGAIADGKCVYVHCKGGVGRTGTVVGCYLVRHGRSGQAALDELSRHWQAVEKRNRWPETPQTPIQFDFVRGWQDQAVPPKREKPGAVQTVSSNATAVQSEFRARAMGSLLGLAVGDAVGTTLEFKAPGSFSPITDMVGGGPFSLKAGEWTDDTSMALCLAVSLVVRHRFDAADQVQRYVRWWKEGYLSSNGTCFDIGGTVRSALARFQQTSNPYSGPTEPNTAGNGSIMRLAPVPIFYASRPVEAIILSGESSLTTHGTATAVDACRYLGALIVGALKGASKDDLLSPRFSPVDGIWTRYPLHPRIDEIAAGSFKCKNPPAIRGTGYVGDSLEAALWAFHRSTTFEEGCLLAVNLGDDADTTGAVYGQLAGAYYGIDGIPPRWRKKLALLPMLELLGEQLACFATR